MRYEFIVCERLPSDLPAEVPAFCCTPIPTGSTSPLARPIDQSDLMSLVARLEYLGLSLIEMRHLPD